MAMSVADARQKLCHWQLDSSVACHPIDQASALLACCGNGPSAQVRNQHAPLYCEPVQSIQHYCTVCSAVFRAIGVSKPLST
eukprot:2041706-Amphidinium_carterae.1